MEQRRPRPRPVAIAIALGVILTAACTPKTASQPPAVEASPAPPAQQAGRPPEVDGITCDRTESVLFHIHTHLAIFANGQPQQVPYGIGIGQPQHVAQTQAGPFVDSGSCFAWLHTHTSDGIIHIESPVTRTFTLGDFFGIWGQPLSANQVGSNQGQVFAYVDGQPSTGDPSDIVLADHEDIQLNVGTDTPEPQPYTFPTGL